MGYYSNIHLRWTEQGKPGGERGLERMARRQERTDALKGLHEIEANVQLGEKLLATAPTEEYRQSAQRYLDGQREYLTQIKRELTVIHPDLVTA